jgi:hypothetical protein
VRGIWKLGLIVMIIVAFVFATKAIADRSFTSDKGALASGKVVPTPQQQAQAPLRIRIALFPGKAHLPQPDEVAIDEIELSTEDATRDFELDAGKGDGTVFFVFSMVEPATFQRYCTTQQLPPMRFDDETDGWVVAATGKPSPDLTMTPTIRCGTG